MANAKVFLPLIAFMALVGLLVWGLKHDPHAIPSQLVGKPLPHFEASRLLKPQQQVTQQLFKGHYSLLNVFASWCAACRLEHPVLMDIARRHQIALVGLNYNDRQADVLPWLRTAGNPYQVIIADSDGRLGIDLGVYGTPESFIIGPDGRILYRHVGALSMKIWRQQIRPKLKQLGVA